jgi:hypothetical protein
MDKFEQQFETLDVRTGYMDAAMDSCVVFCVLFCTVASLSRHSVCSRSSMASTMPVESVDNLMMEIGSEANLNVADLFASNGLAVPTGKVATGATAAPAGPARGLSCYLLAHVPYRHDGCVTVCQRWWRWGQPQVVRHQRVLMSPPLGLPDQRVAAAVEEVAVAYPQLIPLGILQLA